MKSAAPTPKSLPSSTGSLPTKPFEELSSEEATIRQRLEMKAERALIKAAVGTRKLKGLPLDDSTSYWLSEQWSDEQKIKEAKLEAKVALQELCARRLYRSTHYRFEEYLRERFGWNVEEIYPDRCS